MDRITLNCVILTIDLRMTRHLTLCITYSREKKERRSICNANVFQKFYIRKELFFLSVFIAELSNRSYWHINCHLSLWCIDLSITMIRLSQSSLLTHPTMIISSVNTLNIIVGVFLTVNFIGSRLIKPCWLTAV